MLSAGTATKLGLTTQPATTAQSGVLLTTQPVVQIQDASGNAVSQNGVLVTATTVSGTGTLTNATATTNASGVATFSGLTLSGTAGSYTFRFTASGLTQVDAASATVLSAGFAAKLGLTTQPSTTAAEWHGTGHAAGGADPGCQRQRGESERGAGDGDDGERDRDADQRDGDDERERSGDLQWADAVGDGGQLHVPVHGVGADAGGRGERDGVERRDSDEAGVDDAAVDDGSRVGWH